MLLYTQKSTMSYRIDRLSIGLINAWIDWNNNHVSNAGNVLMNIGNCLKEVNTFMIEHRFRNSVSSMNLFGFFNEMLNFVKDKIKILIPINETFSMCRHRQMDSWQWCVNDRLSSTYCTWLILSMMIVNEKMKHAQYLS
jgi:hypothetical protein